MTSEEIEEADDLPSPARRMLPLEPVGFRGWLLGAMILAWIVYVIGCALYGMWVSGAWLWHVVFA